MANTKANRKADPKKTKTGKVRFFGLSLVQLKQSFDKSSKGREKDKLQRRINALLKSGLSFPVVE